MPGFGKDGRLQFQYCDGSQALLTLGSKTAKLVTTNVTGSLEEDFRVIKGQFTAAWKDPTAGKGPILWGICDGDLEVTEVTETLFSDHNGPNTTPQAEYSRRPVHILGALFSENGEGILCEHVEKDIRWTYHNPDGWQFWACNLGGAALTTGSTFVVHSKIFGVWVT